MVKFQETNEFYDALKPLITEAVMSAVKKLGFTADQNLTEVEAAQWLRVKPQTMAVWRHECRGPEYRKHGSRVVYPLSSLQDFSAENRIKTA